MVDWEVSLFNTALGYAATTYLADAWQKPRALGKLARKHCDQARKPLLLIHDGGVGHHLFGNPVKVEASSRTAYPLRVADRTFGAVLVVGVLECLERPEVALTEWRRVADRVFVVVPSWYSPATWLNPAHRWFVDGSLKSAIPLWTSRRGAIHLLPVSDTRYGRRRCNPAPTHLITATTTRPATTMPRPTLTTPTNQVPVLSPNATQNDPYPPLVPSTDPSLDTTSEPTLDTSEGPGMWPDMEEAVAKFQKGLGSARSEPTESWNSVKDLMVISGSKSSGS